GHCAVGAGVYGLQPESMKKIRQHIYYRSADFKKIVLDPVIVKTFGELDQAAKMKMPPKGFDKHFPDMEWLKYRHYFFMKPIPDVAVGQLSYIGKVEKYTRMLQPFNAFLNEALSF
ncbi:MAG: DUF2461 domain-containing protein, partial [Bacteroidales bacterium]|nr:DUF2461 domain-containing protein [Bacteroidales bacterium]